MSKVVFPESSEIEAELNRVNYMDRYIATVKSTVGVLIFVASVAILVATLWLPVLEIYGTSMTPTLTNGDIVLTTKAGKFHRGDIVAFYYNNKILVKRVIATEFQYVSIDDDGVVKVDGNVLEEPYVNELALGDCNIDFPFQVPEGQYFVLGDHRDVSIDSRKKEIGCVSEESIVGQLQFCIWPAENFGKIH